MKTELKSEEQVFLVTRPHALTLLVPFCAGLILILAGILIAVFGAVAWPVSLVFFAVAILYPGYKILERHKNIWAVTNLRVIDEFGVFSNNAKESPLDKINNVSFTQSFWGRIFRFGDVQIQTAAEIGSTTYYMVQKPALLKDTITRMQEELKLSLMRRQATEMATAMKQNEKTDVASEIEKLHDLMTKGIITEQEFNDRKNKLLKS